MVYLHFTTFTRSTPNRKQDRSISNRPRNIEGYVQYARMHIELSIVIFLFGNHQSTQQQHAGSGHIR